MTHFYSFLMLMWHAVILGFEENSKIPVASFKNANNFLE